VHHGIAELAWIAEIGDFPAIQVIFGHALIGGPIEFIGIAGGLCAEHVNRREVATPIGTQSY
jgi:hypothetical protein